MNKQKDLVSLLIKILIVGAFLYVWGILFFYPDNLSPQFVLPNTYVFIGVFIIVIISANLLARHQTKAPKYAECLWRENLALFIVSVFLLGLQLFITWNIVFRTSWDPGAVWYGSNYVALNDMAGLESMSDYFSIYPNNLMLVYFYSRVLKLKWQWEPLFLMVFYCLQSVSVFC